MARSESVYTVQVEQVFLPSEVRAWVDIATVAVKPRAHRRGVIAQALADAGITPGDGDPPRVRVLDAESAAVVEPVAFQPAAEWRVV